MIYKKPLRKFIFPSFIYSLGVNKIKVSESSRFRIFFLDEKLSEDAVELNDRLLNKIINDEERIYLNKIKFNSVNKDTEEMSTMTVERLLNISVKSILFTDDERLRKSFIVDDIDYKQNLNREIKNDDYFTNEYGLTDDYDSSKYSSLGIPEVYLKENRIFLETEEFTLKESKSDIFTRRGMIGFIILLEDTPVVYYEFPEFLYPRSNYIKIEWNTNGFLEVE